MAQSLSNLLIHLIFSTKDRIPFLESDELKEELYAYLGGVAWDHKCPSIAIGGTEDHVYLLCVLHKTMSVSKFVAELKRPSSSWIKGKGEKLEGFSWQGGYGVFSVSESVKGAVVNYIKNQQEHHRTKSFQDEFREFLTKHGIEFDEKYVWE